MNRNSYFFNIFFDTLNLSKMSYSIMNGYEKYPETIGSDIDICVFDIIAFELFLKKASKELDFILVQKLEHHPKATNFFITKKIDDQWATLSLDVYESYIYESRLLFKSDWFLTGRKPHKNFYIPVPQKEYLYYLIKKVLKQDLIDAINPFIENSHLFQESELNLQIYFPKSWNDIIQALHSKNIAFFEANTQKLKEELLGNAKTSFKLKLQELIRKTKRIAKTRGLSISILGPDGSGKSTIIEALKKQELPFRRIDYFHLKPRIIGQKGDGKPVPNPHDKPAYNGLMSFIKVLHFSFDYYLGLLMIYKLKIRSSLVIFDRYFEDLYIDPKRFRYGGSLTFAKFLKKLIPKPDITFVLIADSKVIYSRKQEVPFEELERQITEYENLNASQYNHINVDDDIQNIVCNIQTQIYKKLNERY